MNTSGRNRSVQIFETSVERLARILSEKWKIRVVFKHGMCATEGRTIYLPVIPNDADEAFMDAILGHMDHEVAHILFTDFQAFSAIQYHQQLFTVANAVEDPRVEKKYVQLWRGSSSYLRRSLEWLLVRQATPTEMRNANNQITIATTWSQLSPFSKFTRALSLYPQLGFEFDHWFFRDVVEPEYVDRVRFVEDLIRQGVAAETSAEAIEIAREILRRIQDPQSAPPPQEEEELSLVPGEVQRQPSEDSGDDSDDSDSADGGGAEDDDDAKEDADQQESEAGDDSSSEPEDKSEEDGDASNDPDEDGQSSPSKGQRMASSGSEKSQKGSSGDGQQGEAPDEDVDGQQDEPGDSAGDPDDTGDPTHASSGGTPGGVNAAYSSNESDGDDNEVDQEPSEPSEQPETSAPPKERRQKVQTPQPITPPSQDQLTRDQLLTALGEQIRQEAVQSIGDLADYAVFTTEGDRFERIENGDRQAYKNFLAQSTQIVATLKRRMSRSLLSTKVNRWQANQTRGRINPRAVFRVPLGTSKRVFRKKVIHEGFNTAVEIMVDHSGSMLGSKLELAARTAVVIAEVCHQLGLPVAIYGFSTGQPAVASNRFFHAPTNMRSAFTRWGDLWIGIYKDFNEPWDKAAARCISMPQNNRVNTYDGEALRWGARQLLARKEQRKVLFWLNDGKPEPNKQDNNAAHISYAERCAREVEKHVELLAVGIMTDEVRRFYSNCVVVNDVKDLPGTCLQQFDEILRHGKKRKR